MIEKIYTVTDLGPGDGGKGSVIQSLCAKLHPAVVIKEGGAQGSHGIIMDDESFRFSQWGCGTFNAVQTYLSERMVIAPSMMLREAEGLKRMGIYDAFKTISASPECLCATPYHMYVSQINEMLRGSKPRGTVGSGVGVAYREYCKVLEGSQSDYGQLIFAKDLRSDVNMLSKIDHAREYAREVAKTVDVDSLSGSDQKHFLNICQAIDDGYVYNEIADEFREAGQRLRIITLKSVLQNSRGKTAITERSHGVLTDAKCGFGPHVSALRTLPCFSEKMYRAAGYEGKIINIGVHRAYEYRHGAGPMPSAKSDYMQDLPRDNNRWQGVARYGYLDTVLMRYALDVSQPVQFDGLALTCVDQIIDHGNWPICRAYKYGSQEYEDLANNKDVSAKILLEKAETVTDAYSLDEALERGRKALAQRCADILSNYVDVPLCMLSFGGSERDKYFIPRRVL